MTLRADGTIDFVAHDPARDEALLVMVHDEPWGNAGRALTILQAKFNTYLDYATAGGLISDHPQLAGKAIHIQLRATEAPGSRELEFLRVVAKQHLHPREIRLSWRLIGEPSEHGI